MEAELAGHSGGGCEYEKDNPEGPGISSHDSGAYTWVCSSLEATFLILSLTLGVNCSQSVSAKSSLIHLLAFLWWSLAACIWFLSSPLGHVCIGQYWQTNSSSVFATTSNTFGKNVYGMQWQLCVSTPFMKSTTYMIFHTKSVHFLWSQRSRDACASLQSS